jgi:hypothetical protein
LAPAWVLYWLLGEEQACLVVDSAWYGAIVCVAGVAADNLRTKISKNAEASVGIIPISKVY